MGIETVVGVVGIVVASAISVWTYRKMNPKRQLRYRVNVTPLLLENTGTGGRLTVTLDGQRVRNPQIVELSIWSTGRADIGSQLFDGGTPLTFDIGADILEEVPVTYTEQPTLVARPPNKVLLQPALLHRKFQSTIRVIVDGSPNISVNRVLPDIDVIRDGASETQRAISSSRKRIRLTPLIAWTGVLLFGLVILIVGIIIYSFDKAAYLPWGGVGVSIMLVSLVAILVVGVYRSVRWAIRLAEARSGLR